MTERRRVLLLCDDRRSHASNVLQHIDAFTRYSRHDVTTFDPTGGDGAAAPDLTLFDVVVIHYTIVVTIDWYLPSALGERIAAFGGLKVQFIQDEYRWIDAVTARIRDLGIDVVYSLVPEEEIDRIYGARVPDAAVVTTLAGYVPEELVSRPTRPLATRPVDVGYRGRTPPYWLGRLAHEKVEIGRGFLQHASRYGLRCDIAWGETDRIYGERWTRFMSACRATLGTESGASIADYDGTVERRVRDYLGVHPTASFEEVERAVLRPYEGNLRLNVISPRQFEAAALRTALVLFPGDYSGVLEPDRHYITLEKDFSNMDAVVSRLRDEAALQAMVDRTYDDVVASGRYLLQTFIRDFDELVSARAARRAVPSPLERRARAVRRVRPAVRRGVARAYVAAARLVAVQMIMRHAPLRRLAAAWAGSREARAAVERRRVEDDLVKLALLLEARAGRLAGAAFSLEPRWHEEQHNLTFGSRRLPAPGTAAAANGGIEDAVSAALFAGTVHEIAWNHAGVGEHVVARLPAGRTLPLAVGYHGMNGVHSFHALVRLSERFPDLVFEALHPLLSVAQEALPGPALDEADGGRGP